MLRSSAAGPIAGRLTSAGWLHGLVGRERRGLPPDQRTGEAIEEAIAAAGCKIGDATALVDRLLHLKSRAEVERIEAAGRVLDIGLRAAVEVIAPGVTELEIWGQMMLAMAKAGGQPAALHELVASGPVFLPHAISGRRALRRDEIVYLDPCGVVDRYHANAARAMWIGAPPMPWWSSITEPPEVSAFSVPGHGPGGRSRTSEGR